MSDDDLLKQFAEGAQAWLRENRESERPDTVGHDLIEELGPWVSAGLIEVEPSNEAYFSLIEANYPISVNRLDWSKVGSHRVKRFTSPAAGQVGCDASRERLGGFRGTLSLWLGGLGVAQDDAVVFVGDGSEIAIKMKAKVFLDCFPILLEQPQHGYLLPEDGRWCLNYTMESELFLGESSNASATGWIGE
jgi:hypothetical protein